jgi:hypothetical protein
MTAKFLNVDSRDYFLISIGLVVLCLCGCTALRPRSSYAIVNDVTNQPIDAGYRVLDVDGKPVKRTEGIITTVIPMAIVEPGTHTLKIEPGKDAVQVTTVSASFEAGKLYRIVPDGNNNSVTVVEENSKRD